MLCLIVLWFYFQKFGWRLGFSNFIKRFCYKSERKWDEDTKMRVRGTLKGCSKKAEFVHFLINGKKTGIHMLMLVEKKIKCETTTSNARTRTHQSISKLVLEEVPDHRQLKIYIKLLLQEKQGPYTSP